MVQTNCHEEFGYLISEVESQIKRLGVNATFTDADGNVYNWSDELDYLTQCYNRLGEDGFDFTEQMPVEYYYTVLATFIDHCNNSNDVKIRWKTERGLRCAAKYKVKNMSLN